MSVVAYIEKAQEILTAKANQYSEYIKANPYPAEEIQKAIDTLISNNPEKYKTVKLTIPKVWGTNGRLTDDSNLITEAATELGEYTKLIDPKGVSKSLLVKLNNGHDSNIKQKKLDETQKLLDNISLIEDDLVSKYEQLIAKVNEANLKSKTPVPVDRIFSLDNYNFKSYLRSYTGGLDYQYIFPESFSIVPAFRDLHQSRKAEVPKVEVSTEPSPINKTAEPTSTPVKTQTSSINPIDLPGTVNSAATSPINKADAQKKEPVEATGTEPAAVTSKPAEVTNQAVPQAIPSTSPININLENKAPVSAVTKGEIFNSSLNANATNTTNNTAVSSTVSQNTNTSQVSTASSSPSINSDNKNSVFKSVVKNLADNAISSLNITNSPGFAKNLGNYFDVGTGKLEKIVNPVVNTFSNIKEDVAKSNNENTSVTNTRNAVNNPVSNKSTNQAIDQTSTQTTNSQVVVDNKPPVIPKDVTLAAPKPVENKTSLIETSSQKEVKNNNEVTYKESTQIGSQPKEKQPEKPQQTVQTGSQVNINMGELINEMRAIKLLLMGGIDVNHK